MKRTSAHSPMCDCTPWGVRIPRRAASDLVALVLLFNLALGFVAMCANAAGPPKPLKIVAFGDSLTAGYLLPPPEAFPAQLEKALHARGHAVEIANAGVSGDTTSGGLARFSWAIPEGTDAVILELGANDALRGIDPKVARANLDRLLGEISKRGVPVLLAGMKAPRNWGDAYATEFDAIFPDLAQKHGALLYPFFLEGIVLDQKLNLGDGLHPNGPGVAVIVERILPLAEQLLEQARKRVVVPSRS